MKKQILNICAAVMVAFVLVGCSTEESTPPQTLSQEQITPEAIVNGDIDVKSLSKEQGMDFLVQYESALESDEYEKYTYQLMDRIFTHFTESDYLLFSQKLKPNESLEQQKRHAVWLKNRYDSKFITFMAQVSQFSLDNPQAEDQAILDYSDKVAQDLAGVSAIELFNVEEDTGEGLYKSSSVDCLEIKFSLNGNKVSDTNTNCSLVTRAANDGDSGDCDYLLWFYGSNNSQKTFDIDVNGWRLHLGVLIGFEGYDGIIGDKTVKNISGSNVVVTRVLFGNGIRKAATSFFNSMTDAELEEHLQQRVKLKV